MKTLYKADYVGTINVTQNDTAYTTELGIPSPQTPSYITLDVESDELFLEAFEKELVKTNYMRVYFYKVRKQ